MSSCWPSVMAVLGSFAADDPNEKAGEKSKEAMLHRRLLAGWAAAASEKEEAKNLAEEVTALERALAVAATAREAAEVRMLEAEARAQAAEAELRAAAVSHDAQVEALRRALDEQEDRDARIRELEERIRELNNATSKWRFF